MTEAANNRPTEPGASLLSVLAGESQTQQSAPASASAMDHPDYVPDPDFQLRGAFSNQMIDAAMPLFGLVMRLRKQESHRDIPFLYNAVYNQTNAIVEEKAQAIERTGADLLLAGDLGCLMNMAGKLSRRGAKVRSFHTVEVLAGMADGPAIGEEG